MRIKDYDEFIVEKISKRDKNLIKYIPYLLLNLTISKIIKAESLLSFTYRDMKRMTKGKGEDWASSSAKRPWKIDRDLQKISIKDLPDSKLKRGLYPLFNNWNIYSNGTSKYENVPIFLVSKDNLSEGDVVIGYRGGWDPRKNGKCLASIVLCAKVEIDPNVEITSENIRNIFEELSDEYPIKVKEFCVNMSREYIGMNLIPESPQSKVFISEKMTKDIISAINRSMNLLKNSEGEWDWSSSWSSINSNGWISLKKEIPKDTHDILKIWSIHFSKKSQLNK